MTDMNNSEFKQHREKLGLSKLELAKATGISRRQVANLEDPSGKQRIKKPIALLMKLLVRASKKTLKEFGFKS